ncbi:hypothetical protein D3C80_2082480 [compost metagenome]
MLDTCLDNLHQFVIVFKTRLDQVVLEALDACADEVPFGHVVVMYGTGSFVANEPKPQQASSGHR